MCFNWAPRHEGVLGNGGIAPLTLTSALDGGEWSASRPGRFTPKERASGTHWIGGWVGPRAVLDGVVKRKIPSTRRESNPRTPIVQPVAQCYTDWAITALSYPIYGVISYYTGGKIMTFDARIVTYMWYRQICLLDMLPEFAGARSRPWEKLPLQTLGQI
jgi:hypothetical protein